MIRKLTATAAIMGILMSSVSHAAINPKNIDESSSRDNIYKIIDKKMMKGENGGVITSFAWASIDDNIYSASLRDIRKAKFGKDSYSEAFMSLIEEEVMLDKIKEIQAEAKRKAEERQARLYELFGLERTPMVELEFASITADLEAFNAIANWDAFPESWEDIEAMLTATSMINDEISAVQHLQADLLSIQRRLERGTHELQYKLDALQGEHETLQAEHDALQTEFDRLAAWAQKLHMRRGALENYINHIRWAAGMPTDTNGTWWNDVLEIKQHIWNLRGQVDAVTGTQADITSNGDITITLTNGQEITFTVAVPGGVSNSAPDVSSVSVAQDGTITVTYDDSTTESFSTSNSYNAGVSATKADAMWNNEDGVHQSHVDAVSGSQDDITSNGAVTITLTNGQTIDFNVSVDNDADATHNANTIANVSASVSGNHVTISIDDNYKVVANDYNPVDSITITVDGVETSLTSTELAGNTYYTTQNSDVADTYNITLNGITKPITEGTTVSLADFDVVGMSGDIKVSTDLAAGFNARNDGNIVWAGTNEYFQWTGSNGYSTEGTTFQQGNIYQKRQIRVGNQYNVVYDWIETTATYFGKNVNTVLNNVGSSTDRIIYINDTVYVNTSATGEDWKTVADAYAVDQLASVFNSDAIDNLIVEVYETGVATERALWSDFDREVTLNNDGTLSNVDSGAMVAKVPAIVGETYGEVVYTGSLSPSAFAGQLGGSQTLQQLTGDTSIDNNATALKVTFTIDGEEVVKYYNYKVVFGSTMDWTAVSQSDYETAIFSRDAIYYTKVGTEWHVANSHYSTVTKSGNTVTVTGKDAAVYTLVAGAEGWEDNFNAVQNSIDLSGVSGDNANDRIHNGLTLDAGIEELNYWGHMNNPAIGSIIKYTGGGINPGGLTITNQDGTLCNCGFGTNFHYKRTGHNQFTIVNALAYYNANTASVLNHSANADYLEGLDARIVKSNGVTLVDVDEGTGEVWIQTSAGNSQHEWDDGWGIATGIKHVTNFRTNPDHSGQFRYDLRGEDNIWYNNLDGIEKAIERAFDKGYENGYEDGYKQGYADGFEDGVNSITN